MGEELVGQRVTWTSSSAGGTRTKWGKCVAFVPKTHSIMLPKEVHHRQNDIERTARKHATSDRYIVLADAWKYPGEKSRHVLTKGKLYVPLASLVKKA